MPPRTKLSGVSDLKKIFLSIFLRERNSSIEGTRYTIKVMFGKLLFVWYLSNDTYLNDYIDQLLLILLHNPLNEDKQH